MHILTIVDHPNPASFTHAVAARFSAGAQDAGHTTETADLHAEGFQPVWTMDDVNGTPKDIAPEQARIERADALCLAFPLYWYGMPAMTKGWIDRVWSYGWAYDQIGDPNRSLLRQRPGVMLIPAAANPETWTPLGIEPAMDSIWRKATFGYFGLPDMQIEILGGSDGSDARRQGLLDRAFTLGQTMDASAAV